MDSAALRRSLRTYVPDFGDLVHMDFDPSAGREWAGKHWALVISDRVFAAASGMAVVVAITSKTDREHRYEVRIQGQKVNGMILPIHVRSVDYRERTMAFTEKCPKDALHETLDKLSALLHIDANSR